MENNMDGVRAKMEDRRLKVEDVVTAKLSKADLAQCIDNAKMILNNLNDRENLHKRDDLERFNNILMGEVAECMVINWIRSNGKYVRSTVDKTSGKPDLGHDIELKRKDNDELIKCSIKSSLTYTKDINGIINEFKLATTRQELREVNIQVYFWLELNPPKGKSRTTVTSLRNSAIVGWFGKNDLTSFEKYNREEREAPSVCLIYSRPMKKLLEFIK